MNLLTVRAPNGEIIPDDVLARHMLNSPRYKQWLHEQHMAQAEQRMIARQRVRHGRKFKVIGRVSESVYNHWKDRFAGQTNSDGSTVNPWHHDEFWRDLQRDNPELRPNVEKRGNHVGYEGGKVGRSKGGKSCVGLVKAGKYTRIKEAC
jgi:hypothetical protein